MVVDVQGDILMFVQFSYVVFFQFCQQCWDGVIVEIVIGKVGWYVYLFEELMCCGDGGIDMLVVRVFGNILYVFGILQQFFVFGIVFFILQCWQYDSQCLGVIQVVYCCQFVVEYMCCLVLWYVCVDQVVQCLCCCLYNIGVYVIVFWFLQGFWVIFDQGQENVFGEVVLDFVVNWVGYVLFEGMDEGVNYVVCDLVWWQGIGINWIEDCELWLDV